MFQFLLSPISALDLSNSDTELSCPATKCLTCDVFTMDGDKYCEMCEAVERAENSRSFTSKIKSRFGFELSTELIVLSLEEPDSFFTESEIDSLINPENMVPLDSEDVPNWEIMFFASKRVKKPKR